MKNANMCLTKLNHLATQFIAITFTFCDMLDGYLPRSLGSSETGLMDTTRVNEGHPLAIWIIPK